MRRHWPRDRLGVRSLLQPDDGSSVLIAVTRGGGVVGWDLRRMQTAAFGAISTPAAVLAWDAMSSLHASPLRPAHLAPRYSAAGAAGLSASAAASGAGIAVPAAAAAPALERTAQSVLPHPTCPDWLSLVLDDGTSALFCLSSGTLLCASAADVRRDAYVPTARAHGAAYVPLPGGQAALCSPLKLTPRTCPSLPQRERVYFRGSEGDLVMDGPAIPPAHRLHCELLPHGRVHYAGTGSGAVRAGGAAAAGSSGTAIAGGGLHLPPSSWGSWPAGGVFAKVGGLGPGDGPAILRPHPHCYTTALVGTLGGDLLLMSDWQAE
jgi:hypothetical protein